MASGRLVVVDGDEDPLERGEHRRLGVEVRMEAAEGRHQVRPVPPAGPHSAVAGDLEHPHHHASPDGGIHLRVFRRVVEHAHHVDLDVEEALEAHAG